MTITTSTRRRFLSRATLLLGAPALCHGVPTAAARGLGARYAQDATSGWTQTILADVPDGMIDAAGSINNAGIIVGRSSSENRVEVAVLWRPTGEMEILPTLGGPMAETQDINEDGVVAGAAMDTDGNIRPVLWADGVPTDLGTLGGLNGIAYAVNNLGHATGVAEDRDGARMPFLWRDGEMTNLGSYEGTVEVPGLPTDELDFLMQMGGTRNPRGINDAGQVVGEFGFPIGFLHPVLWQDGEMIDLGTLGGDFAGARSINNAGQVSGWTELTVPDRMNDPSAVAPSHAFIWRDGEMSDLGAPSAGGWSRGNEINESGQVAIVGGLSDNRDDAYVWSGDELVLLSENASANGINDAGVVVGAVQKQTQVNAYAVQWSPPG